MQPTQNNDNSEAENHHESSQQAVQSQTDSTNALHQDSQTEKITCQDTDMQTKEVNLQHASMQTTPKEEKQSSQQTERVSYTDTDAQTVYEVRVVQPSADFGLQAGSWNPTDSMAQTDQSMSLMVEGLSQTELIQHEAVSQTDPTITADQSVQIQVDQTVGSCQTIKDEQEVFCQTEVNSAEVVLQTDLSMANLVDGEAQATVDMVYQASQATVDVAFVEAQTDSSMANQFDQEAQATVDVAEQDIQTDIAEVQESYSQTQLETDETFSQTEIYSEEKDMQTEYIVIDNETQTEIEEALPVIENEPQIIVQETIEASQVSSIDEIPSLGSTQVMQLVPEFSEEGCQTDPVTIIIGDASFLVKKLKSSSLSPTKVSSMGNEIEIELRADEEETPYDLPEKENTVLPTPVRSRGTPSPYRARGVRTRGGSMSQRGNYRSPNTQYAARQQVSYQAHNTPGTPYYSSSAGVLGKYSCPVCSDTFHESPALYEHLQQLHSEAFGLIKKPKGREGKTIQLKVSPDPEPPILTPVEPITQQQQVQVQVQRQQPQQKQQQKQRQYQVQVQPQAQPQPQIQPQIQQIEVVQGPSQVVQEDPQGVGLFEDPTTWQSPNKSRKRTLARRQITDEEEAAAAQDGTEQVHIIIQPTEPEPTEEVVVRKRKQAENTEEVVVKRVRTVVEPPDVSENEVEETEVLEEETPRRRSRSNLRAIKQEKVPEAVTEEVKTPRSRGRPRGTAKKT